MSTNDQKDALVSTLSGRLSGALKQAGVSSAMTDEYAERIAHDHAEQIAATLMSDLSTEAIAELAGEDDE